MSNIQAVKVRAKCTRVLFSDDVFVSVNLDGCVDAIGRCSDSTNVDSPAAIVDWEGSNETLNALIDRAVDEDVCDLSTEDLAERCDLAMEICENQAWIQEKRARLFGTAK